MKKKCVHFFICFATVFFHVANAQVADNCLHFDGTDDLITIGTNTALPTSTFSYTIEAWINPDAITGAHGIAGWGIHQASTRFTGFRLGINGANKTLVNYWWGNDLVVNIPDISGSWHHVACTYDNATNARKLYLDGVMIGSDNPGYLHNAPNTNFRIGITNPGEIYKGKIDEMRVWNVARTASQLTSDMSHSISPASTGLVAYYTFDQGTAGGNNTTITTLYDLSVNNKSGTLGGFALSGITSNWLASQALQPPPIITSFAPKEISMNSIVTITGSYLSRPTNVSFGGVAADSIVVISPSVVTARVKEGASGSLQFTTLGGTAFMSGAVFFPPASISSLNPINSKPGSALTINGSNFIDVTALLIGGVPPDSFTVLSDSQISAVIGPGASSGNIVITTAKGGTLIYPGFWMGTDQGNALHFDGSNDYVLIGINTALPVNNSSYTIEAWIRPDSITGAHGIAGWGLLQTADSYTGFRLGVNGANKTLVHYWWGNDLMVNIPDISGTWHHVACTYDSVSRIRSIYLDGVFLKSDNLMTNHLVTNANFTIGRTNPNEFFKGRIDELRIWNIARSKAQLNAAMNNVLAGNEPGLIGYYPFNSGTADGVNTMITTLSDRAGAKSGTLTGMTLTGSSSNWVKSHAMRPSITSFTPASAGAGQNVTIRGTNLTDAREVSFGGIAASSFLVSDDSLITATVGTGATGNVSVITYAGTAVKAGFTIIPPPTISSFTPASSATGAVISINGTNLTGATAVSFGGIPASSFTVVSAIRINATVGAGASGVVSVSAPGGTADKSGFVYIAPPVISSFSPAVTVTGTTVTIRGILMATTSAVSFGDIAASSFLIVNDSTLTAVVGNGTSGDLRVTGAGGTAVQSGFVFIPAPVLTNINPINAKTGVLVSITGTGFTGATTVSFGGVAAQSFNVVSPNLITAIVGAGASGNVSISGPGGTGTKGGFWIGTPPGNALDFDGTNDCVLIGTHEGLPVNNESYTIEAWVKLNLVAGTHGICSWGGAGANQSNGLGFTWTGSNLTLTNAWGNNDFNVSIANTGAGWHHVACSYNNVSNTRLLYLDGQQVGGSSNKPVPGVHAVPNINFAIGRATNSTGFFNGIIDELKIWKVARTPAEINNSMKNLLNGNEANLVSYYNFNSGSAYGNNTVVTVLNDITANAKHGTLTNMALNGGASNWVESYAMCIPVIHSFSPDTAITGDTILIRGKNFEDAMMVQFAGTSRAFTILNDSTIRVLARSSASGSITITTPAGTDSMPGFIYIPTPFISSFTPVSGAGMSVTIQGSNFTGATAVSFGGVPAASFTVASATTINAIVGSGASGEVRVSTPFGSATRAGFVFVNQPVISSFVPLKAITGSVVTIRGANLLYTTAVNLGAIPASSFTILNDSIITAMVGSGASGNVSVITPGGTAAQPGLVYTPPPVISSFYPVSAVAGHTVTITGKNFTYATAVSVGGVPAQSFNIVSSTTIKAVVGAGASGNITITGPGGKGSISGFSYGTLQGNALHFDGVNDIVSIGINDSLPGGNSSYTIEAWVNPDQITGAHGIAGWGALQAANRYTGFRLGVNGANKTLNAYWWANDLVLNIPDITGTWHHVACTYNNQTRARVIYLDGNFVGSDTPVVSHNADIVNLTVGRTNPNEFFKGKIDELRIWKITRTRDQLITSMQSAVDANEPGLVSYYPFNQGFAEGNNAGVNILADHTANKKSGMLTNMALNGNTSNWVSSGAMPAPAIISFSPSAAGNGQKVLIRGNNFINVQSVTFGGTAALSFTILNPSTILAVVSGGSSGAISVTSNKGTASKDGFTHLELSTWTGASGNDWNNPFNWSNGVPDSVKIAYLSPVSTLPLLNSNITVGSFRIDSATILLNTGNLVVAGNLENNGTIRGSGEVLLRGNNTQVIYGSGSLENLTLDNTSGATVESEAGMVYITGTLSLLNGTFGTNGLLTIVSGADGTGRIANIDSARSDISGNVTVQRYVPAVVRRSRMLSPSVSNFNYSQYIDDMFISGAGGVNNGFDASPSNGTTIYTYQETTGGTGRGWKAISKISDTLNPALGSLVFVRGDRTLNNWAVSPFPQQNELTIDYTNQPISKGTISPLITYTNTNTSADDGWNMVGNPYPSQIDWNSVPKTNLSPFYYSLDPQSGSYVADHGENLIASGQAFFIQAIAADPGITFIEGCKATTTPVSYFKTANTVITASMIKDSFNSDLLKIVFATGAQQDYNPMEDAIKMTNSVINFASLVNHDSVQLQYNKIPHLSNTCDTIKLYAMAASGSYSLRFSGIADVDADYSVQLFDAFTNNTQNLRSNAVYTFSITGNAASKGNDRFKLIFTNTGSLPVKLLSFAGQKANNDVKLNWSTANEKNSSHFVVERSDDNTTFTTIGMVRSKGNSSTLTNYSFSDLNAFVSGVSSSEVGVSSSEVENLYYRLIEIDKDNTFTQSHTISIINSRSDIQHSTLSLYPNPATSTLTIQSTGNDDASVEVEVTDAMGKMIMNETKDKQGDKLMLNVSMLQAGVYVIKYTEAGHTTMMKFVKE